MRQLTCGVASTAAAGQAAGGPGRQSEAGECLRGPCSIHPLGYHPEAVQRAVPLDRAGVAGPLQPDSRLGALRRYHLRWHRAEHRRLKSAGQLKGVGRHWVPSTNAVPVVGNSIE